MRKPYVTFEKEVSEEDEKRIRKNLLKIRKGLDDLESMGYNMYLSPNNLSVCDGDTHKGINAVQDQSVVVANIFVTGIDGGDW